MYDKTITFTFDLEKTYKSFYAQFFNGIDDYIIEAMECRGGIVDLTESDFSDTGTTIHVNFREES